MRRHPGYARAARYARIDAGQTSRQRFSLLSWAGGRVKRSSRRWPWPKGKEERERQFSASLALAAVQFKCVSCFAVMRACISATGSAQDGRTAPRDGQHFALVSCSPLARRLSNASRQACLSRPGHDRYNVCLALGISALCVVCRGVVRRREAGALRGLFWKAGRLSDASEAELLAANSLWLAGMGCALARSGTRADIFACARSCKSGSIAGILQPHALHLDFAHLNAAICEER
ncbi:hypothetical protein EXIGLDRAFT_331354 [Exidia glandulosa HHB12029]|uniref:Uncharacterized protein n=1 Tax=Exidia glandulosa HHB12029 TaxID=1314781 RepID=A0A165CQY3_EXIGL|nr:hypothetical protein EXIGLDRAFT_331354 [Exidia glandulosa HHB12029]